jgi:WD40 repeat protein
VVNLAFNPHPGSSGRLVTTCFDGHMELWDVSSRRSIWRHAASSPPSARLCAFSPNGRQVATIESVGIIRMIDAENGHVLTEHDTGLANLYGCLRFSPDGALLACATDNNQINLYRTSDLTLAAALRGHTQTVHGVAFSPDSSRLASAGADSTIRLWDVGSGREVATLHGHEYTVYCLAFTADGRTLISGGADNTIRFWDAFPCSPLSFRRDSRLAAPVRGDVTMGRRRAGASG